MAHESWDAIVAGSGIGGMAAAAALARRGRRVLVLERHTVPGGQTQSFRRGEWRFATGVHYLGGLGPDPGPAGQFGRLLGWLSGGELRFAACDNPYDLIRLPGFEFGIEHPEAAYRERLHVTFPREAEAIDGWFEACDEARSAAFTLMATRNLPPWLAWLPMLLRGTQARHWAARTIAQQLQGVNDPRLRAVLAARWGDHGGPPASGAFVEHALVTGSYNAGAWYPVGGPDRFAQTLLAPVEAAGGRCRLGAELRHIDLVDGRVDGAVWADADGSLHHARAPQLVSDIGLHGTLATLDESVAAPWRQAASGLAPGLGYVALYLGLEGPLAPGDAGSANHWIYGSDDVGRVWQRPLDEDAPGLFVSFASAKDPAWQGPPTAEVLALVSRDAFAPWLDGHADAPDYAATKDWIAERLLGQFQHHFPRLAGRVRFHEAATPLTQRRYVATPDGSMYGLAVNPERMGHPALALRTPVPGLLLTGQDVMGPGVQAAFMGGLMAAAAIEPALWREFGR